jgi:hypothetical protein
MTLSGKHPGCSKNHLSLESAVFQIDGGFKSLMRLSNSFVND